VVAVPVEQIYRLTRTTRSAVTADAEAPVDRGGGAP
jgi:hypothetical protein